MTERILGFSKDTFAARRARVLDGIGDGVMIISAAPLRYRSRTRSTGTGPTPSSST